MKRFLSLCLVLALVAMCAPTALAASPNGEIAVAIYDYARNQYEPTQTAPVVALRLNGAPISGEIAALVVGGRTLAPLRLLAEQLGAEVEWVPDAAQVVVRLRSDTILLTLGSATAYVNGQPRDLPDSIPATAVFYGGQGHTMVPVRFFSESFHCRVDWEQSTYTAWVSTPGYAPANPEPDQLPGASEPVPPGFGSETPGAVPETPPSGGVHQPALNDTPAAANPLLAPLDTPIHPEQFLIALDAGHGGTMSGAYYEQVMEKNLTLPMTQKLNGILRALGYRTLMTRSQDVHVALSDRATLANDASADVFVSIHCNAAEHAPYFQGLYVYHFPGSSEGKRMAQFIQTTACEFTAAVNLDINSDNFLVLRETTMPAVLVETGFMTCHEELTRLKDDAYQTRMAQGIAQGIIRYLNAKAAEA